MRLRNKVKESEHLLLRGVDDQVLALGNVQLQEELLLDTFDLGYILHLPTELANVDFLNGNSLDGRAHAR